MKGVMTKRVNMKTKTTSMYSTSTASCRRILAGLSGIAQIRLLDHLIVTTARKASKSYCSIQRMHQELFQ